MSAFDGREPPEPNRKTPKGNWPLLALSLLLTAAAVAYLWQQTQPQVILRVLSGLLPAWAVAAVGFFLVVYSLRSVRYCVLLGLDARRAFLPLLEIVAQHNALNYLLPARLGEFSYIVLARRRGLPVVSGAASLGAARLLDLATVCLMLPLAVLLHPGLATMLGGGQWLGLAFLPVLAAGWLLSPRLAAALENLVCRFADRRLGQYLCRQARQLRGSLALMGAGSVLLRATLPTLGVWVGIAMVNFSLLRAFGLPATLWQLLIVTTVVSLGGSLPLQGVLGFGTTEALWTLGLTLVGVELQTAVAASFAIHLVTLAYAVGLGALGSLSGALGSRRALGEAQ